jgi:hypothetical protein
VSGVNVHVQHSCGSTNVDVSIQRRGDRRGIHARCLDCGVSLFHDKTPALPITLAQERAFQAPKIGHLPWCHVCDTLGVLCSCPTRAARVRSTREARA